MKTQLIFCFLALGALPLFAAGPCPTITNGSAAYLAGGGGCNTIITFNADGSVTTTVPNPNPFDGGDDTLVGVVNNSSNPISSFSLTNQRFPNFWL